MLQEQRADDVGAVIREKVRTGILPKDRPAECGPATAPGRFATLATSRPPSTPCFGLWHQERATYLGR
jgi:hypothetical protein